MPKEPTIVESSETEHLSGTESVSLQSSTGNAGAGGELGSAGAARGGPTMEDLFAQLAQETRAVTPPHEDEFKRIRSALSRLPQLESKLEAQMVPSKHTVTGSSRDITRINDPIEVQRQAQALTKPQDAGARWFHMKQPEMTAAVKRDLQVIKQRAALDPKRHYKKDKWQVPKYFEMGTIVEGSAEFYSARMKRRERGNTLVEEVLHDEESKKYFRRKYSEIQALRTSGRRGHYKKVKEMRRKY
jgi:hypothetical protein